MSEQEPVAWAVMPAHSDYCVTLSTRKEAAQKAAEKKVEVGEYGTMDCIAVVPLYRHPQPALTDEERDAVGRAVDWLDRWQATHGYHSSESGDLATLCNLLERMGGGR